jgi:uncharacterized protein (TIGR02466 family)
MNIKNYSVFPSIINEIDCNLFKSIKSDLVSWIYEYQKTHESVQRSNVGGWQSQSDFHLDSTFKEFKDYILFHALTASEMYNLNLKLDNMWINVNQKGNYNLSHCHPASLLSGVMWIKTPDNCGNLVFESPNGFSQYVLTENIDSEISNQYNYFSNFYFTPVEGRMVIFPSSLQHWVDANKSMDDRISIAFNLVNNS